MFLLNNIHDRPYASIYPSIRRVLFDIGDKQLSNSKNNDWLKIKPRDICCVITSSRNISSFFRVDEIVDSGIIDPSDGKQFLAIGEVVAKLDPAKDMTVLFRKFGVNHAMLPRNKLSIGLNVVDLAESLDDLLLKTRTGNMSLGEIKASVSNFIESNR